MKKALFISLIAGICICMSCKTEEERYHSRLDGDWKIARSVRTLIMSDGSTNTFEDLKNAGTVSISDDPQAVGEESKIYSMVFTNAQGKSFAPTGYLSADDNITRVFFYGAFCDNIFNCDLVWTVETNKRKQQVWSTYLDSEDDYISKDYDPSDDSFHQRWEITLEK